MESIVTDMLSPINGELPIKDCVKISFKQLGNTSKVMVNNDVVGKSITLVAVGNCYFTDSTFSQNLGKTMTFTSSRSYTYVYVNGMGDIYMPNDNIRSVFPGQGDTFLGNLRIGLNIEEFNSPGLVAVGVNGMNFATGDIKSLGKFVNLLEIFSANSNIYGNIEDLADEQVLSGRTSGSIMIKCNGVIKLNGEVVGNNVAKTITFNNGSYTIA